LVSCTPDPATPGGYLCPPFTTLGGLTVQGPLHVTGPVTFDKPGAAAYQ